MISPGFSITISPGTMCENGISTSLPSRITAAVSMTRFFRSSAAFCDLYVLTKSIVTETKIIKMMMPALTGSPRKPEAMALIARMIMSGFLKRLRNDKNPESFLEATISFGPNWVRSSWACAVLSPLGCMPSIIAEYSAQFPGN